MKRRGFTMVELMTVIAIIVILGGLLIVGINKMHTSAKRQQTRATLHNATAMFADYQAALHVSFRAAGNLNCPQNVTDEYFKQFWQPNMSPYTPTPRADRYCDAVLLTRDVMAQMQALPANASAMGKMGAENKLAIPSAATPNSSYTFFMTAPAPFSSTTYNAGDRASVFDSVMSVNQTFACIKAVSPTTAQTPPKDGYWLPEPPITTQVTTLLDAWGNPIIFVPSGLGSGVALNPDKSIPAGSGALKVADATFVQVSADNRPYFASAGPDGDFSTGDDNIYSFEQ